MHQENGGGVCGWDIPKDIRDFYRAKLRTAQEEDAAAARLPHADEPKFVNAREAALLQKQTDAARSIVRLVGHVDTNSLRGAVEPESLKEVLLRGGADVGVLMRIGEGREEFSIAMNGFRSKREAFDHRARSFRGNSARDFALDSGFKALDAALDRFKEFDLLEWKESHVRRYMDAVQAFHKACFKIEEDLARWEKELPSSSSKAVSVSAEVPDQVLTPRQRAERAFSRFQTKDPSSSQS